jgi:hypothetical protein
MGDGEALFAGGFGLGEGRGSFLKKRTKKLLRLEVRVGGTISGGGQGLVAHVFAFPRGA